MNIYEEVDLEEKLEEITDLVGQLLLDMLLVSLRKISSEHQIYSEFAETRAPQPKRTKPF
jgi:hypothetical protein